MAWILGPGDHPLRLILQSHIADLSRRKWGIQDMSWIVTQGGSSESLGSPPWQNICRAWSSLKPFLRKSQPRNVDEWRLLPLWRPHHQHIAATKVQCNTLAQHRLRDSGLITVGDTLDADGRFQTWDDLQINQTDSLGHRAYNSLLANIRPQAHFEPQAGPHRVYFGEESSEIDGRVWLYDVPQELVSSPWPIIRDSALPISTFHCRAGQLQKIPRCCPPNNAILHRSVIRHSVKQKTLRTHYGLWTPQRHFLWQYKWSDGSSFLDTSTAQLRALQANQHFKPHAAALRWVRDLGCNIPDELWRGTWLNFRGATENTFLWQMYYRSIATQRWRFPSAPADDPRIQCTRCVLGAKEDIVHCLWGCPMSYPCWQWGQGILLASTEQRFRQGGLRGSLEPAHVFVASPLPADWLVPTRLWQILRAVISWQVWKTRNEHFMADRPSDPRRSIRKAWHRLSMYLRKEWAYLRRKISRGRISLAEAVATMQTHFGKNQEIWTLHGVTLQVPPTPPRPP